MTAQAPGRPWRRSRTGAANAVQPASSPTEHAREDRERGDREPADETGGRHDGLLRVEGHGDDAAARTGAAASVRRPGSGSVRPSRGLPGPCPGTGDGGRSRLRTVARVAPTETGLDPASRPARLPHRGVPRWMDAVVVPGSCSGWIPRSTPRRPCGTSVVTWTRDGTAAAEPRPRRDPDRARPLLVTDPDQGHL